jgi:hypothetical protein
MHENQVDNLKPAERDRLQFPEWQVPLHDMILESDRAKLGEKMHRVEGLMSDRLQRLRDGIDGDAEREAINNALTVLRAIQREKLDFPDWK